ncbi:MAG: hypothetical protein IJU91_10165 [Selenomonadaceae bacterium]|nr:hypothetical protein [Selenomonadaceae bacterium]
MDAAIRKDEVLTDDQLDNVTGGAPEYVAYFNAAKAAGIDTSKIRVDNILGVVKTNPAKNIR